MSLRAVGTGLSFDGVDDYVEVPDDASLDITTDITIEAWVYPEASVDYMGIVIKGDDGAENYEALLGDQLLYWAIQWTDGTRDSEKLPLTYNTNEWMHLVTIYDIGNNVSLYKNGEFVDSDALPNKTPQTNDVYLGIGRELGTSRYFNGHIDSVRIYNRALSAEEIKALYRNEAVDEGLVLYLPLNAGSGDTAKDFSGQGNNGTINGARWYGFRPVRSGGLQYDGVDDNVDMGDVDKVEGLDELTVEGWVYPHDVSTDEQGAIRKKSVWRHMVYVDKFAFRFHDSNDYWTDNLYSSAPLSANKWYHLVAIYEASAGEVRLYINGSLDSTHSVSFAGLTTNTYSLQLGHGIGGKQNYFNGSIALVRIYNRALSDQEIADLYLGKEISREGLVLDMPLNEGQGSVAHDYSGEGNNGTINGPRWYGNMPVKRTISAKRAIAVKR